MKKTKAVFAAAWLRPLLAAAVMLAVMAAIFCFSGQNGADSSAASDAMGAIVADILDIEIPQGQSASSVPIFCGFTIRKCAHIFLYMMLGTASFFFVGSVCRLKEAVGAGRRILRTAFGAVGISFLYACFDELHQSFVGGRTATMRDVQIDAIGFCGAAAVLAAFFAIAAVGRSICIKKQNSAFSGGMFEQAVSAAAAN